MSGASFATHRIEVARTARVLTNGEPRIAREIWFLLHGHAQLAAEMLESCRALAGEERLLVVPEALSRFYIRRGDGPVGATWMTREEREAEISDYVRYLDCIAEWVERELGCRASTRAALGFSQGAKTAWRWAALGHTRLDRLIGWGSDVPPDLDLGARRGALAASRLQIVHGAADLLHTAEMVERDRGRLASVELACEIVEFGGSHAVAAEVLARLIA